MIFYILWAVIVTINLLVIAAGLLLGRADSSCSLHRADTALYRTRRQRQLSDAKQQMSLRSQHTIARLHEEAEQRRRNGRP